MGTQTGDNIWVGLARELVHRPDVRPDIKAQLARALERDDPDEVARDVQVILAKSVADLPRSRTSDFSEAPAGGEVATAKHALALVEHALARIGDGTDAISPRLALFLREALLSYASAYDQAEQPSSLESAENVTRRVLARLEQSRVKGRTARIGILTPREVAGIAASQLSPSETGTIRSCGNLSRDLDAWKASPDVSQERKDALSQRQFVDGEYLFAFIQPTPTGQVVEVHAITGAGRPTPQPVTRFEIQAVEEPVSLAEVLVAPAVVEDQPPQEEALTGLIKEESLLDYTALNQVREAAVSINQARVDLYAEILRQRTDLRGAARKAAERRLQRMQDESESLAAGAPEMTVIEQFLAQWSADLSRDFVRFADRTRPSAFDEAQIGRLEALSRMGALKSRMDDLLAGIQGTQPTYSAYRRLSEQARILVSPQMEASSIFDTLGITPIATRGQAAGQEAVAGEQLSSQVILRDAQRAVPPASETQRSIQAVARAGRRLQQALTDISTLGESGLHLSGALRPLLRAEGQPMDIRPDTRSPLLRHLLLPAMERVSGSKKAFAQMGMPSLGGGSMTPDALYGALLGEQGRELIERQPQMAKNLMQQMGGLSQRLQQAGTPPSLSALSQVGADLRQEVGRMASGGPAEELVSEGEEAVEAAAAATGTALEQAGPVIDAIRVGPVGAVDQVAGALQEEETQLSQELRSRIEPFVQIPSESRVFAGPVASTALSEMGAQGATVGRDVYIHEDVMRAGADAAAPILGHEFVHAGAGFRSVESEEQEAYGVESMIRQGASMLGDLVKEISPEVAEKGTDKADAGGSKKEKTGNLLEALTEKVAELWARDIERDRDRQGA